LLNPPKKKKKKKKKKKIKKKKKKKKKKGPFKNEKNERTNPTDSAIEMDYKMSSNLKNTQNEEIGNEDYQMVDNDIEEEDVDDYEEYEEFDP